MPLNLASPGIVVREVDLTIGRVDSATDKTGAIVGPFAKGPVNTPVLVESEQDLLDNFGEPYATDKQYESWMVASSYLAYGGALNVVRATDADMYNGFVGAGSTPKIESVDDYNNKGYDTNILTGVTFAARNPGSWSNDLKVCAIDGKTDQILSGFENLTVTAGNLTSPIIVGSGITQAVPPNTINPGAGSTSLLDGHFKGIVTEVDTTSLGIKLVSHVSLGGTETAVEYQPAGVYRFANDGLIWHNTGWNGAGAGTTQYLAQQDWFDQQTITLTNSTLNWNQLADRPGTSSYAAARSSRNDEVHVVIVDDKGTITGNAGTILEKHLNLSKAKDAEFSAGSPSYWRKFLVNNSEYVFGGSAPAGITTSGFTIGIGTFAYASDNGWDQNAQGINFGGTGLQTLTLAGGRDYGGSDTINNAGSLEVSLAGLSEGYELFEDDNLYAADFLLMGSAAHAKETSQALANKLIATAELRKDSIAFISPYRAGFISDGASATVYKESVITDNVISFYAPITSSSYSVFDSGYKYMYDRFSDTFRYVPLNGDIAGTCARNDINNFPWFSPAGTVRGSILNAVKLAYNPSQVQRDKLYSNRINSVIFSPGAGITLFGDKTGLGKASAFDRINVRRLFIYLENAISAAARDQMFEFNDEITRTNFVNIVEPFLRDVQAKRGIFDFRVVCDETNNTAAIIDNNEFVADIFVKPARSINFIGLTFVATRTGVSFDEVIGTV